MISLVGGVFAGVFGLVLLPLVAVGTAGAVSTPLVSSDTAAEQGPTPAAIADVPPAMLRLYMAAAATCPGLDWTVIAAIGTVESDNGDSHLAGVHSGSNSAGAEGPMQFEPATFAVYDRPVPPGGVDPPSPYDPVDAVYAAARMLCANGGHDGADVPAAVWAYDHSTSYVDQVIVLAASYGRPVLGGGGLPASGGGQPPAAVALGWALGQVGTPYAWGGETAGVGFDCSGLVQAAYRTAGITLPRVAQDQYDAGPLLPPGLALEPGDLVFFGASALDVTHVGMVVSSGIMVDAPHSGADVRLESFPTTPGAGWGGDIYLGATRPGAR